MPHLQDITPAIPTLWLSYRKEKLTVHANFKNRIGLLYILWSILLWNNLKRRQTRSVEHLARYCFSYSVRAYDKPQQDYTPRQSLPILLADSRTVGSELLTTPKIVKPFEGISLPSRIVDAANTPIGNVKPHHPILNGNLPRLIDARAKKIQTSPNPHIINAVIKPNMYNTSPAIG